MLHSILVKSTDYDLTTTSALKLALGISGTSDDSKLSALVRAGSRWAEAQMGYPATVQTYRELRPSYSSRRLMLSRTPIRAVVQLLDDPSTDDGVEVLSSEFNVDREPGFLVRDEGWYWTAPMEQDLAGTPRPGQESEPWLIDYVAGWTYNGISTDSLNWSTGGGTTDTGRTLPDDLERAVIEWASAIYTNPDGVVSENLGDLSVTYKNKSGGAGSMALHDVLISPYMRRV